jgi:putative NADH-flavin reductase
MNITIIGASSGVGMEAVKRALTRNHCVTTLSRSKINLHETQNLKTIQGSATNKAHLRSSIANADAVIVALGTGKSIKPTTLYSDFARLLVELQREGKLRIPFIILTGFGAGESGAYNSFWVKLLFRIFLKDVYDDKTRMEEIIASSTMTWVMVRPGFLKDRPLTESYRVETSLHKGINIGAIGRADVADYLVKQAEDPTGLWTYPALSSKK